MQRSTFGQLRTDVLLSVGNREDINVLVRDKINEACKLIGCLTPHKELLATKTFSTANTDFDYDLADDYFALLSVRNVTDSRALERDHYFRLDKIDESVTGTPTRYAVYGGTLYVFDQVPDGVYSIKYRYWKLHPFIEQTETRHSLDEVWDGALRLLASSLTLSALNRHQEAAMRFQQYTTYVGAILGRTQAEDIHDQTSGIVYGR